MTVSSLRIFFVVVLLQTFFPLNTFASLPYPAPIYEGFRLAFEDDFNGPLNEGIWNKLDNYVQNAYVPFPGIPDLVSLV
jgi:hypothetical protein